MRRRLPILLSLSLLACLCAPTPSSAATIQVHDPITDNYKASYNADPSRPELRTWFSARHFVAAGTTWRPSSPDEIAVGSSALQLHAADGRSAWLSARVTAGPVASIFTRVDPTHVASGGRWGLLIALSDRAALAANPVSIALTMTSGTATVATGVVEYRRDAALASVTPGHLEFNGPGGRWYVGGVATRTEWAPAPAVRPTLTAGAAPAVVARPRITRIYLPLRTTRRVVSMRVRGRAGARRITHIRVAIGGRGYGRWTRVAPRYRIVLPRGVATHRVRVQLRDAAGRPSRSALRRVRCICR